jgi:hypothetical protein
MQMEERDCSETLAFEILTPGNKPKGNTRRYFDFSSFLLFCIWFPFPSAVQIRQLAYSEFTLAKAIGLVWLGNTG